MEERGGREMSHIPEPYLTYIPLLITGIIITILKIIKLILEGKET